MSWEKKDTRTAQECMKKSQTVTRDALRNEVVTGVGLLSIWLPDRNLKSYKIVLAKGFRWDGLAAMNKIQKYVYYVSVKSLNSSLG